MKMVIFDDTLMYQFGKNTFKNVKELKTMKNELENYKYNGELHIIIDFTKILNINLIKNVFNIIESYPFNICLICVKKIVVPIEIYNYLLNEIILLCKNSGVETLKLTLDYFRIKTYTKELSIIKIFSDVYNELKNVLTIFKIFADYGKHFNITENSAKIIKIKNKINNEIVHTTLESAEIEDTRHGFIIRIRIDRPQVHNRKKEREFKYKLCISNKKRFDKIKTIWNGYVWGGENSLFYKNATGLIPIEKIFNYI